MIKLIGGRRAALLSSGMAAGLACFAPMAAAAQGAPPPSMSQSDRDARIAALEAEVQNISAQLAELKAQQAGGAPAAAAPATIATAGPVAQPGSPAPTSSATSSLVTPGRVSQTGGAATPTTAAVARIDSGHPSIQSADGRFTVNLLGVMQFDAAEYFQDAPGPISTDLRRGGAAGDTARARDLSSGTSFRRARIGMGGRAFGDFEYGMLYEFAGAGEEDAGHIQELWVQYSGFRPAHLRVGAFAPFIGLEDAGSTNGMLFLERPSVSEVARGLAGGDFREAIQLTANKDRWFVSAATTGRLVGVVNSTGSGVSQPYDSQLGFVGRAAILPYKSDDGLVHVGIHGSYVANPADALGPDAIPGSARFPIDLRDRPELRVDAVRLIDTGSINARHAYTAGAEFAAQYRNLFIQSEYERIGIERRESDLPDPNFSGFYVEGSWVLTGERRRYNNGNFAFDGPQPTRPFSPSQGGWGAWELGLRYSQMDLNYDPGSPGEATPADGVRGGEQKIFTAGVNWYINPLVRVMFEYQHVSIDRLSPNAATFLTPIGAQVGQSYDTGAIRTQIAF